MAQGYEDLLDRYTGASAEAFFIRDSINKWEQFKNSAARNSVWKTKEGKEIKVKDLSISHIQKILTYNFSSPLPEEWKKLLKGELAIRNGVIEGLKKQLNKYEEVIKAGNLMFE